MPLGIIIVNLNLNENNNLKYWYLKLWLYIKELAALYSMLWKLIKCQDKDKRSSTN